MANETVKRSGWRKIRVLAILVLCLSIFLTGCTDEQISDTVDLVFDIVIEALKSDAEETQGTEDGSQVLEVDGNMTVHFIDVGQADATLFVHNGETMLYDAATKSRGDEVVEYIKGLGIEKIDVLVLTHPHDDHMGGSAYVLNNIEVGVVYGPDIFDIEDMDGIGWYEDMLDAIEKIDNERNVGVAEKDQVSIWTLPRDENGNFVKFNIGDAVVEFMAPLEDEYSDKNDYSICAKVSYGTIDFMLTGDATDEVEEDILAKGYDLDVEIFHAGHHGSDTSNSKEFLDAMTPECIVISCGMKNKYNHPVESVIELFEELKIPVYRTDESGNIVLTTDGTTYSFSVTAGTYTSGAEYRNEGN